MRLRKACLLALVWGSRNSEFRGRGGHLVPDLVGWGVEYGTGRLSSTQLYTANHGTDRVFSWHSWWLILNIFNVWRLITVLVHQSVVFLLSLYVLYRNVASVVRLTASAELCWVAVTLRDTGVRLGTVVVDLNYWPHTRKHTLTQCGIRNQLDVT